MMMINPVDKKKAAMGRNPSTRSKRQIKVQHTCHKRT
jgi:hypothetical protein